MIDVTIKFICDDCGNVHKRFYPKQDAINYSSHVNFGIPPGWRISIRDSRECLVCNNCSGAVDKYPMPN